MPDIVKILLRGFADTLDKVAPGSSQSAAIQATAAILNAVAKLLEKRSAEESLAILEAIRDRGADVLTSGELDAQVQATLDKAGQ